jgi:hypothetical protein
VSLRGDIHDLENGPAKALLGARRRRRVDGRGARGEVCSSARHERCSTSKASLFAAAPRPPCFASMLRSRSRAARRLTVRPDSHSRRRSACRCLPGLYSDSLPASLPAESSSAEGIRVDAQAGLMVPIASESLGVRSGRGVGLGVIDPRTFMTDAQTGARVVAGPSDLQGLRGRRALGMLHDPERALCRAQAMPATQPPPGGGLG